MILYRTFFYKTFTMLIHYYKLHSSNKKMKKNKLLFLSFFMLFAAFSFAQQKVTISGYIRDADSGEDLIAASVVEVKLLQGAVTNTYGFYSLTLPKGKHNIKFTYVGYAEKTMEIDFDKDKQLNIKLEATKTLNEVEVIATKAEKIEEKTQMSQIDIPIETIKRIPALLGEVDVLKAIQLLPGVQSGGEGQNGLYVRGGSPDQNLILLDGVPVYNASHILGFFSVFNADAIKNVTLVKGGFPARYGGRLSSVIDISMKEGNNQKFQTEGSIGLISSKLSVQGPIYKDKVSFIVSARRTYLDVLAAPFIALAQAASTQKVGVTAYFYDFNAKVNYKINDKHRIFLSNYSGKDILGFDTKDVQTSGEYDKIKSGTNYGNLTTALRWNWQIKKNLFANTTLTSSRYNFNFLAGNESKKIIDPNATDPALQFKIDTSSLIYKSGIKDLGARFDLDFVPNPNHYIRTGVSYTSHSYNPGALQVKIVFDKLKADTTLGTKTTFGEEVSAYFEDDLRIGPLKANIGLHASTFLVNKKTFNSLQPRIGLNYLLNNSVAIKASFATMAQFINLLTNEQLSLPTDLWVPSTDRVKPQTSWQVALGAAKTFGDGYEFSIEGYYKEMKNVLSYKPGSNFLGINTDWQDKIVQGNGQTYGAEFFLQKKTGKLNGWIGYTLAWNFRQFDGINNGVKYPFKYDRRHDIDVVINYDFNKKWSISGAFVYGTGNAITLPTVNYQIPTIFNQGFGRGDFNQLLDINQGSAKNAYRMNPYHRLDVNVEYHKKHRRNWESTLSFGAYNVYNRKNPYFIRVDKVYDTAAKSYNTVFKQYSLFGFIIPSISYAFKF